MVDSKILLIGVKISLPDLFFSIEPCLYWDSKKGDEGYHAVIYANDGSVLRREYIWGTGHEEQAGVNLDEIINRRSGNWYWVKTPIEEFPNAGGFFVLKNRVGNLDQLRRDFPKVYFDDEFNDKPVYVGFGTSKDLDSLRERVLIE